MEFILTALSLLTMAFLITLPAILLITFVSRRHAPAAAQGTAGNIAIASAGVLIYLVAMVWIV